MRRLKRVGFFQGAGAGHRVLFVLGMARGGFRLIFGQALKKKMSTKHNFPVSRVPSSQTSSGIELAVIVELLSESTASLKFPGGKVVEATLPMHVDVNWLRAAAQIEPVEALVFREPGGRVFVHGIYPSAAHENVSADLELSGRKVRVSATNGVELVCRSSRLKLNPDGSVLLRGKTVQSRAERVLFLRGGRIRLN